MTSPIDPSNPGFLYDLYEKANRMNEPKKAEEEIYDIDVEIKQTEDLARQMPPKVPRTEAAMCTNTCFAANSCVPGGCGWTQQLRCTD